jgi:transcriptional regulator with XRE-family HTH domain
MTVGERLRQARKAAKISGEKLGAYINVSKGQISNIEKGASDLTKSNAIVLSQILGVSLEWLLTGKDATPTGQYSYAGRDSIQAGKNITQNGNCEQQLALAQLRIEGLESEVNTLKKYIALLEKNQAL